MTCAIILAAGQSRRMGTQKLLLPIGHLPLITRVVDEILRSSVTRTFVVVSRESERIAQAITGREVTLIRNPDDGGEMLSSLRCGLRALPTACDDVLVVPGDLPGISSEVIESLMVARRATGRSLVLPVCGTRRGHPLLVGRVHWTELLTRHEGTGLRGLVQAHPDGVCEVPVDSASRFADMDLPEDYAHWRAILEPPGSQT